MGLHIYRLIVLFIMAAMIENGSVFAMPSREYTSWTHLQHPLNMVKRSTFREMGDVPIENVILANKQRRSKRQYYPPYPGHYDPVYPASYYYPSYPGFYNPVGTGSLWAAGGGLVGNTLSFILGK